MLAGISHGYENPDTIPMKTVWLLAPDGLWIYFVPLQDRLSGLIHFFIGDREWFLAFKKRQGNPGTHDYNPVPSVGLGFIKTQVCPSDQRFR